MKKRTILLIGLLLSLLIIMACAPGGGVYNSDRPAGFFVGIWHGWIAPISLIWGLFNPEIRVYEPFNTGWWYDLGFYIAIVGGFGSFSFFRRKKRGD
jgi:hypothetical protein